MAVIISRKKLGPYSPVTRDRSDGLAATRRLNPDLGSKRSQPTHGLLAVPLLAAVETRMSLLEIFRWHACGPLEAKAPILHLSNSPFAYLWVASHQHCPLLLQRQYWVQEILTSFSSCLQPQS